MSLNTTQINSGEFCALSTSEYFLTWLYENDSSLHYNLISHLKLSKGCSSNRDKMLQILNSIQKDSILSAGLLEFLKERYPQLLRMASHSTASPKMLNTDKVFTHYDPDLNTFPRRMILTEKEGGEIGEDVSKFCADKLNCETLIIEDKAYIEYLLPEHVKFKDAVPEKNWEIIRYKKANNIK